jgi:uncharacterized protein YndB with AHSA1/START domain
MASTTGRPRGTGRPARRRRRARGHRDPDKDAEYGGGGHYTEIDPPNRLAFTWTWDNDETRQTLVETDFEEAEGVTRVRFTHSGLRDKESVRSHEGGWTACFDNVERTLKALHPGR